MWDSHRLLRVIANIMFAMVAIATVYVISLTFVKPIFFPLEQVNIQVIGGKDSFNNGRLQHVTPEEIETLINNEITGNFFSVDLINVRELFISMPWVREAKVEREWPHGLNIMLEEHQVLAYWGSHALVNTYGEVFRVKLDKQLPVFTGPTEASSQLVAQHYERFREILAPLEQSIAVINLSHRYAWRIHLESGTVLELGRNEIEKRLKRYASVYNNGLAKLNQHETLEYVDLRYPNGFAVRMPEATQQISHSFGAKKQT
ncbi:MAG: cell division protein FtsQ/DivIB [Betaproteobacteria bacterium]|nr:cell division protein FtsQ/DivIB [Betaproteobacteria bacterium]